MPSYDIKIVKSVKSVITAVTMQWHLYMHKASP